MISYRKSNLFESLNKMNICSPGDIFEGIANMPWPHSEKQVWIWKGTRYIFSHMYNGKMVLIQKNEGSRIFFVSPSELNKYFKRIGHADFQGLKVGDYVYTESRETGTFRHYIITALGLYDDDSPMPWCRWIHDSVPFNPERPTNRAERFYLKEIIKNPHQG